MIINAKKAINLRYEEAEKITELSENEVLVSIVYPNCELNNLKISREDTKVLTIFLHDVPIVPSVCAKDIINKMNKENRPELEKFYKFYKENRKKDFYIHCAAGISRSAALVLFLRLTAVYNLKDNFIETTSPNPSILKELLEIYYDDYRG